MSIRDSCYSCPAETGACPIGAFQAVVGSSRFKFSYYITGFFILLGVTLGRFICGFLCPFGWFQDLLHKIPGKKFSTARLKPLRYLKYIILVVFVILLPMLISNSIGMGDPFFCKYICCLLYTSNPNHTIQKYCKKHNQNDTFHMSDFHSDQSHNSDNHSNQYGKRKLSFQCLFFNLQRLK